jgi:hypothetical protein
MQSALQTEEATSEDLAVQLERIADALERLAVRRKLGMGRSDVPAMGKAVAGGDGSSLRWAFRNQGIRAALRRAAARHLAGGASA